MSYCNDALREQPIAEFLVASDGKSTSHEQIDADADDFLRCRQLYSFKMMKWGTSFCSFLDNEIAFTSYGICTRNVCHD